MSDTKISDPAPNWCRTCGRRPNDPMAALCLDTHHRTLERLHPQPAELAEQQGPWSSVAEEMAYSEMHAVVQRAGGYRNGLLGEMLRAGMQALAATGKQQAITGPTGPDPFTLHGLIVYGRQAANPNQGAVPSHMCNLIGQMVPHLERLDALEKGKKS